MRVLSTFRAGSGRSKEKPEVSVFVSAVWWKVDMRSCASVSRLSQLNGVWNMVSRTFLGKIRTVVGSVESISVVLLVSRSMDGARALLKSVCRTYRTEEGVRERDGGFDDGDAVVYPYSVVEIGVISFLELSQAGVMVRCSQRCEVPTAEDLGDIKAMAKGVARSLKKRMAAVRYSWVLEAMASAVGVKGWQVLKAKVEEGVRVQEGILEAARDVVELSDATGCSDDLTVTSASAMERLRSALNEGKD